MRGLLRRDCPAALLCALACEALHGGPALQCRAVRAFLDQPPLRVRRHRRRAKAARRALDPLAILQWTAAQEKAGSSAELVSRAEEKWEIVSRLPRFSPSQPWVRRTRRRRPRRVSQRCGALWRPAARRSEWYHFPSCPCRRRLRLVRPCGAPPRAQVDVTDVMIQPQKTTPPLDASKWPLLLKNYDKLNVSAFVRTHCTFSGHRRVSLWGMGGSPAL